MELLLIEASPRHATSSLLGRRLAGALQEHCGRAVTLTERQLGRQPLAPLSAEYAESLLLPIDEARERYGAHLAQSDELVAELERADMVVIASPVHNFTVPAALKLWLDLVVRNGVTFKNTPEGKVGLLRDRPVLVAVTSGGAMFRDPPKQPDFFRPYLSAALGVVGLHSVSYVSATALAFTEQPLAHAASAADAWIAASLQGFLRNVPDQGD
ncbi:FMN-dependent NADH-azoreductase [Pseudoduganella ginsengisoli]|uniref:FMN dependent NADH:quinone oxidoreductase n=1 Tax=Pseudoduganella ginsengisoli TaxID=1462440 RepID=A0A6L6Q5Z6_9BURK|nr:NAD(P)H-dependent oxidoreductase [Pseudoduganella ginsengisoli]MTW04975.1 flavodoxin family protein [Pseudoduganella ginsengisoli]